MTSVGPEILGLIVVCAVIGAIGYFRKPQPTVPELVADALVESALLDGWDDQRMAEACDTEKKRNHLAPLSNTEINRRIGAHMDAACRQLRTELETPQNWSA